MGDRGNIVIEGVDKVAELYLYTHWSGSNLPQIVSRGLVKGKQRWGDEPYLNRVLFQTMIGKDDGLTGYGISAHEGDGGTEVYICHDSQTVRYNETSYSFSEFIAAFH